MSFLVKCQKNFMKYFEKKIPFKFFCMFLIKLEHFEKCLETFFAGVGFFSEILILQVIFGQIPKKFMKYFEKKKLYLLCMERFFGEFFGWKHLFFRWKIFFVYKPLKNSD